MADKASPCLGGRSSGSIDYGGGGGSGSSKEIKSNYISALDTIQTMKSGNNGSDSNAFESLRKGNFYLCLVPSNEPKN